MAYEADLLHSHTNSYFDEGAIVYARTWNRLSNIRKTHRILGLPVMIRTAISSSRKLGEAAEHLIDGSEKCICRLSFES